MALDETLLEPDAAWTRALEKYGAATRLTLDLYGLDELLLLGHLASMFTACVQRCLTQPAGASTIVVEQRHSLCEPCWVGKCG